MAKKPTIHLKDYRPPDFVLDSVQLDFDLGEEVTRVRSVLSVTRSGTHTRPLTLDGEELELTRLLLDGRPVERSEYAASDNGIALNTDLNSFAVELEVVIRPQDNTELSGLYRSSGNFCTQCEAEGFRRITYFIDRPDVLSRYRTTITADREKYPVLLSNGNLVKTENLPEGRHRVVWNDPFPKPSYLFAVVAGDLGHIEDEYTTRSGRSVRLYIYTQHHNVDKCDHAMASLKKAMRWDEQVYGREYDLDRYMIVAVDDFNMGAMENKGLNIFNSKYVLAKQETATDADYDAIEGVIAHEYFHNWSGNRVTCRDWFQLSLKEGFTVFRDQEFSADMGSRGVKRIQDVNALRVHQFPEDAGPLAHPVRPQSYKEINNFYTATVYNKGAEVVRMLYNLVGADGFRRATDLYFDRFDGQAVTTDDFVRAIEDANGVDLSQFKRWYDQAGTPVLEILERYDAHNETFELEVAQSCPPTPGQQEKLPFHIPLAVALLDRNGRYFDLDGEGRKQVVLEVREPRQTFRFDGISSQPVVSALRGFSAPVKVKIGHGDDALYFLMVHDTDPFSRWEAAQRLSTKLVLGMIDQVRRGQRPRIDERYFQAFRALLRGQERDQMFLAELLTLPSEAYMGEFMAIIDPDALYRARCLVKQRLGEVLGEEWLASYHACREREYAFNAGAIGRRRLKNTCLDYLVSAGAGQATELAAAQFREADNMTDAMGALKSINDSADAARQRLMDSFYETWKHDNLVVDKWLALQATSRLPDTLDRVRRLTRHESFNVQNPNRIRALVGTFAQANGVRFHDDSGGGYAFVADYVIELDAINPQVASRLATVFNTWQRYDARRQSLMRAELQRILDRPDLSSDVEEIAVKALENRSCEDRS